MWENVFRAVAAWGEADSRFQGLAFLAGVLVIGPTAIYVGWWWLWHGIKQD